MASGMISDINDPLRSIAIAITEVAIALQRIAIAAEASNRLAE